MKKTVLFSALVVVFSMTACNKEVFQDNVDAPLSTVTFTASAPDTKTAFTTPEGSQYPVLWTDKDTKVSITHNYSSSPVEADITRSADNRTATFTASFTTGSAENTFVAVSPASALATVATASKRLNLEIPSGQICTTTSPDQAAMVLYAKSSGHDHIPSDVALTFSHYTGYFHLVFTNYEAALAAEGATVQSVSITSAKNIAGRVFYFPETGESNANAMSKTVSVATSDLSHVWVGLAPVDLSGETIKIVVGTDKGTMTKNVSFGSGRNLTSGKIAKVTVDMDGIAIMPPVRYNLVTAASQLTVGDHVIIAAANYDRALSTNQKSINRDATSVTKGAGYILDPSDAVEVIELEDGVVPGEFALKVADGYLYAAGGSTNNYLKTAEPAEINASTAPLGSWNIQILDAQDNGTGDDLHEPIVGTTDHVAMIQANAVVRGKMFYNGSGSNNLFSAYAGFYYYTSFLQIYRLDEPAAEHFKASMPDADGSGNVDVGYSGGDLAVYVFGNSAWNASVTGGATLSATSGTGNAILTLTVPENTSKTDAKAYTVTVSTTAGVTPNSYTFNLTQAKAPGVLAIGDVLWAENWLGAQKDAAPATGTGTTVFGGADVTYTRDSGSTKMYTDGLVFLTNKKGTESPGDYLNPDQINNLLVKSEDGFFKVAGIPCGGVATATLTYKTNTTPADRDITVTTDTENVTVSALVVTSKKNTYTYSGASQTKTYYEVTCTVTFGAGFTGNTFNLQFNNGYTANIRLTQFELTATTLK